MKNFFLNCDTLDNITTHSYIARAQAKSLKNLKESLNPEEVIVLGDFAEKYMFVIQDEIQGYHCNKQQCTLHPVVNYYRMHDGTVLTAKALCFISDDLDHDVNMVYNIIKDTVTYIKTTLQIDAKKVIISWMVAQYKNCKNFLNL